MIKDVLIEICCGSITDVKTAIQFPIDRIELNSALELGGLTPSLSVLKEVKQLTDIPVCCMARCRCDGFYYNDDEYDTIFADAELLLQNGADGIVFGFLNSDKTINIIKTKEMVQLIKSYHKEAIFHKAFDEVTDMNNAVELLIECGIDRILTSGGINYPHIENGIPTLKELNEKYGSKIHILPGGGIRKENIHNVLNLTGIKQVHMTASKIILDPTSHETGYKSVHYDSLKKILEKI